MAVTATLLIGFLIYGYASKLTKRAAIKKEITTIESELIQLQSVVDQIARIKAQRDALNAKKTALGSLVRTRLLYPIFMEDTAKILPNGMWLLNLNTRSGDVVTELTFNAVAYNNYIVADLLQSFGDSKSFQNPEMSGITSTAGEKGVQLKQFSITVSYINREWK